MMCIQEDCKGIMVDREWFRLQSFVVMYYLEQRSVLPTVQKVHTNVPRALAAGSKGTLTGADASLNGSRWYKEQYTSLVVCRSLALHSSPPSVEVPLSPAIAYHYNEFRHWPGGHHRR